MILQTNESEKVYEELSCQFIRAIKELKISHVLSQCNIRKDSRNTGGQENSEKRKAFEMFWMIPLFRETGARKWDFSPGFSTMS